MRREKKGSRRSKRPRPAVQDSVRTEGRIYPLREEHLALFAEVRRLRPELAPLLDVRRFEPGVESIEAMSRDLHLHLLAHGYDPSIFMVFCQLNSQRLRDSIALRLDDQGLPYEEDELLAEVYARLFRFHFGRGERTSIPFEDPFGFESMGRERSVFAVLTDAASGVLAERIEMLRASTIPMPGAPMPEVGPAAATLEHAAEHLLQRRCRLKREDLAQWVAHALLALSEEERRLIHLREKRELPLAELAKRLDMSPLDAARRLKDAVEHLSAELDAFVTFFDGSTPRDGERSSAGRATKPPESERGRLRAGGRRGEGARIVKLPRGGEGKESAEANPRAPRDDEEDREPEDDG